MYEYEFAVHELGRKLREVRQNLGMTQAGLGAVLGLSSVTIALWEKNRIVPGPESSLRATRWLREVEAGTFTPAPEHLRKRSRRSQVSVDEFLAEFSSSFGLGGEN